MSHTFTPPLVKDRPPFLPDSSEVQKELWQHFENRYRGVNVWLLTNGEVVQDTATAESNNTDMSQVYPWNPNHPTAPYVRSIYVPALPAAQVATEFDVSHSNPPVAFFPGGSTSPITTAQYNALLAYTPPVGTGYADCLT